jgi:hypothetical protein
VTYQYNAAGNINAGAVQTRNDLANPLVLLGAEVEKAKQSQALDDEVATDVEYRTRSYAPRRIAQPRAVWIAETWSVPV